MRGTNEVFYKNPNLFRLVIQNRVFLGRDLYVPNFNIKIGGKMDLKKEQIKWKGKKENLGKR
jgi:hypothetical protein